MKGKKPILILNLLLIGLLIKLIFVLFFKAFQTEQIFSKTLGNITHTYQNTKSEIISVKNSFIAINDVTMNNWDAAHYHQIKSNLYEVSNEANVHEQKSYAFFPLYPLLWRITALDFPGIAMVNYLLFIISIIFLFVTFYKATGGWQDAVVFGFALLFPSSVVFHMPYAEALFLFSFSFLFYGIKTSRYWLFFIFAFIAATVKPAITITIAAFICTDILFYLIHSRNLKLFFKEVFLKIFPLVIGFFTAALYQYQFTDDFFKFMKVQQGWEHHFRLPDKIADWSVEGFGISTFAIAFVLLPAIVLLARFTFNRKNFIHNDCLFHSSPEFKVNYIYLFSIIHFIGVFAFILLFQGGVLNGLQRYILATPFFYAFYFISLNKLSAIPIGKKLKYFMAAFAFGFLFLLLANKLNGWSLGFSQSGFFIAAYLTALLLMSPEKKNIYWYYSLVLIAVGASVVFLTYLFNQYLCSGWIFT